MSKRLSDGMDDFPEDARWLIQRADGFLDLAMPKKAREELEKIPLVLRDAAPVRIEWLRLAFTEKDWPQAAKRAGELCALFPDEPAFWIERAYAIRRSESIEAAREVLAAAVLRFPDLATIHFNLACYDCQLGRLDESLSRLERAVALDSNYRETALEDDDLKPLWEKIG